MKRLGQKRVQFSKVIIPGTVKLRQLMAEPRVKELAKSFREDSGGRPLQPPTLDAGTYRLVAGADRFAACKLNGDASTIFEIVEGSEKELRRLSIVENLRRRNDDQQKLMRELVEAEAEKITQEADSPPKGEDLRGAANEPKGTRPKGVHRQAVERVAAKLGTTPKAVERKLEKLAAKEREEEPEEEERDEKPEPARLPAPPPTAPPIRTLGIDLPKDVAESAADGQALVDEMSSFCTTLAAKLTSFEKRFPELGQQQRAREGLEQAAHAIRSLRPACLCPHCKAQPKPMKTCACCRGLGSVPKVKLVDVPKELMAEGDEAGIYIGGKWTLLDAGF